MGGSIKGGIDKFFSFYFFVSNGIQSGDVGAALSNNLVKQSYTFNKTGIIFFDNTEGYLKFEWEGLELQVGRERVLWGRSTNKIILSENPPIFDFIKFKVDFGIINLNFIHGWLTQPLQYYFDTVKAAYFKIKNPKYIAISRIGINPFENFSVGITQEIIYANRPVELAYLNPFLFFESAQRSMNDLDNSFLGIDAKYNLAKGFCISSEIIFDDINFSKLYEGFGSIQTRYTFDFRINLTSPILPFFTELQLGLLIIRPFMYSHFSENGSLTYSNNGYLLGSNIQPNSIKLSIDLHKYITSNFKIFVGYEHIEHGDNIYDLNGNIIRNTGGNFMEYFRDNDTRKTIILDGDLNIINRINVKFTYDFTYAIKGFIDYNYIVNKNGSSSNIGVVNLLYYIY